MDYITVNSVDESIGKNRLELQPVLVQKNNMVIEFTCRYNIH